MRLRTPFTTTAPLPLGDAAARRAEELETLYGLGRALARAGEVSEVLESSLRCLVDTGWFSCGEAFVMGEGEDRVLVVGRCPSRSLADDELRPGLFARAREWLAANEVGDWDGWTVLPIERRALLTFARGDASVAASPGFLRAVVEVVSSALRRAALHGRLAEKERQRSRLLAAWLNAQEEERGRIARDLHDQIGQALTALLLGLDESIARPDSHDLGRLKELTAVTLDDVRRIALDLRPSVLDELGLEPAVRRFARDMRDRHGLDIEVEMHLPRLSRQSETVLYRVTQEALTNVLRHARASSVSVVATSGDAIVQLVIEDDGAGFDEAALEPAERVGLIGMRERLELLGGGLRIETGPGRGTTVHARLPRR